MDTAIELSTANLDALPDLEGFVRLTQALAALDAVMAPDWQDRYFSFNARWGDGEQMASMRNGSGDDWFALISDAGIALVGLAHEAPSFVVGAPQPWVFDELPNVFHANVRDEPAFDAANTTFCVWRLASDSAWSCGVEGEVDDGSSDLLWILAGDPQQYVAFAENYYEVDLSPVDVEAVYRHEPLTAERAQRLNPDVDWEALKVELDEIAFPYSD